MRFPLRLKVLLSLALAGLCLMGSLGALLPTLVVTRFDRQEERRMHADTLRVARALGTELESLGTYVLNWSAWDDTYAYVGRPTRAYEASNLIPGSFEAGRLNLIVFLNRQGDLVPITLSLFAYIGNNTTQWNAVMATAVVASVPAAVLLVLAQRYVAAGVTAGAVKD